MRIKQNPSPKIWITALCLTFAAVLHAQTPDPTLPPASAHAILTLRATGSQIYACEQTNNTYTWTFVAPVARLFDESNNEVATHGDGPTWTFQDDTSIHGTVLQKSPSPEPNAIPWLLLKATTPTGSGIAAKVDFIRRSDTHGGSAPTTGCDAQHLDTDTRVPYTAVYTFYSTKP
jgi:hypothetical protein